MIEAVGETREFRADSLSYQKKLVFLGVVPTVDDGHVGLIFMYEHQLTAHEPRGGVEPVDYRHGLGHEEVNPVAACDMSKFVHVMASGHVAWSSRLITI